LNQGDLSDDIIENAKKYCLGYSAAPPDKFQEAVLGLLDLSRAEYQLSSVENDLKMKLEGDIQILEVGSGLGSFLMVARQRGIDCYGIEPDVHGVETAVKRMPELKDRIRTGVGESLPYKNGTFDLVVSFQVVEHAQNPEKVLKESVRVLKKGGSLYFVIPNYNSFWEGHYGLYWLPRFPKPLAKLYLRLCGREPSFLDGIQYITPKMVSRVLSRGDVEIVSLGRERWEERMDSLDFTTWGYTRKLLRVAKLVHKLRMVSLIKTLGGKLDLYFPIIVIAKKN